MSKSGGRSAASGAPGAVRLMFDLAPRRGGGGGGGGGGGRGRGGGQAGEKDALRTELLCNLSPVHCCGEHAWLELTVPTGR